MTNDLRMPEDLRERIARLEQENAAMQALMELACADIIFFYSMPEGPDAKVEFSVNVNDLFYPGADAEGFSLEEAIPLRDLYRKGGWEGVVRWVQQRRDNTPLRPKHSGGE